MHEHLSNIIKRARVVAATALVMVAVATNGASHPPSQTRLKQTPPPGTLSGTVMDMYDARVVGATIRIQSETAKWTKKYQWQGRSDDEGEFSAALPPGTYQIYVWAPGFRNFASPFIKVRGETTEMLNIHLKVAAVIDTIRIKRKRKALAVVRLLH